MPRSSAGESLPAPGSPRSIRNFGIGPSPRDRLDVGGAARRRTPGGSPAGIMPHHRSRGPSTRGVRRGPGGPVKKIAGVNAKDLARRTRDLVEPYRVETGKGFRLADFDPGDTGPLESADVDRAKEVLRLGVEMLAELQDRLYAQDRWNVLLIFQAMDAAGKDGTIKHVLSGVNPQGVEVHSFKQPSQEELDHDFLWRCAQRLPERGRIGIFNRSYYEEVLVVRVHPKLLERQQLPEELVTREIWEERYRSIRDLEQH